MSSDLDNITVIPPGKFIFIDGESQISDRLMQLAKRYSDFALLGSGFDVEYDESLTARLKAVLSSDKFNKLVICLDDVDRYGEGFIKKILKSVRSLSTEFPTSTFLVDAYAIFHRQSVTKRGLDCTDLGKVFDHVISVDEFIGVSSERSKNTLVIDNFEDYLDTEEWQQNSDKRAIYFAEDLFLDLAVSTSTRGFACDRLLSLTTSQFAEELRAARQGIEPHFSFRSSVHNGGSWMLPVLNGVDEVKSKIIRALHQNNCVFEVIYRYTPESLVNEGSVAALRIQLGRLLARALSPAARDAIDCVVPVPSTGKYYAQGLSMELGKPYVEAIVRNESEGRSFDITNTFERRKLIKRKLRIIPSLVDGKNICIVDEAIFTGTTLKILCQQLRESPAGRIYIAIPTSECVEQCEFEMQPRRNLLAEYTRREDLASYYDVTEVAMQDPEIFSTHIKDIGKFCQKCFLD